jgi:glycosyltransferase involved in cell wall biosynthesis
MSAEVRSADAPGAERAELSGRDPHPPGPNAPPAVEDWPLGLVRTLDLDGKRHSYAVGRFPAEEIVGELGSCHSRPGPGSVPLWVSDDGRYVVTEGYRPSLRRPGLRKAARWVVAPVTWSGLEPVRARVRSVLARAAEARRRINGQPLPVLGPVGAPVGYLDPVGAEGSPPLYAGLHPIVGDQLLTTDQWELVHLGYVDIALLGFLIPVAPLTGRLWSKRPPLPWASRYGSTGQSDLDTSAGEPAGAMLHPTSPQGSVALPFLISGWAVAPAGVSTVEVTVDDRRVGFARIGIDHLELAERNPVADAPVSRFEFKLLPSHIAREAGAVHIKCTVCDMEGARLELSPVVLDIAQPENDIAASASRAAQLQDRMQWGTSGRAGHADETVNVLVFTHDLGYGGAQLYLVELLERLLALRRLTATVVAPSDGPLRTRMESLGIRVHVTSGYPVSTVDLYEGKIAELLAWAGPQEFDIALVNTMMAFPGIEVADRLGIPSIFSIHESYDFDELWVTYFPDGVDPYVRERGRWTLSRAAALVFEAEATRRQYVGHGEAQRFLTLPYGIEIAEIDRYRAGFDRAAARRAIGATDETDVVLCLGTVEPRKAQAVLAKAFSHVADSHREAMLLHVGRRSIAHDPYAVAIDEYAKRVGLKGRIRSLPMDPEPYRWHGVSDLLVCASDLESLPRVVLEGMAFGTPVLATDIFGLGELIEDGKTGYLCQARDVASLARGLGRVLSAEPAERAAVGSAGSERVRSRHDPAVYADQVWGLVTGLVPSRRAMRSTRAAPG